MKKLVIMVFWGVIQLGHSQVTHFNQYPTLHLNHVLDENLDNISFALSMRILVTDYNGPLIRLRRDSDNAEQDFFCAANDIVNIDAINTWRGTANVFVVTWYDQSGLGRNAAQATLNRQPRFIPDATIPYFRGDGNNDRLDIFANTRTLLTNNGREGTVLGVIWATQRNQTTFGVLTGLNRWSSHINWGNNNAYFDPGRCCNNPRFFNNASTKNSWEQYTFVRTANRVITRSDATQRFNGTISTNRRYTGNNNFGILYGNGTNAYHATNRISELIMYNTNITAIRYQEIEENAITFWGL